jgi:hypothetical protein
MDVAYLRRWQSPSGVVLVVLRPQIAEAKECPIK